MKVYQNEQVSVNNAIQLINPEALLLKASEGLLAISLELGLEVIRQMMEGEVNEIAGAKSKHKKDREVYRHGKEGTTVVLGGMKVQTQRPRVRRKGGAEVTLKTLAAFQEEDHLNSSIMAKLLSGVSCRKYSRIVESTSGKIKCISKSEVARRFSAGIKLAMDKFFSRRIEGSYPAMMLDGMVLGKITIIAAMGIRSDGKKQMLGIIEGGSENSEVAKALLTDLLERGLDPAEPRLYTIDGSKALAKAIRDTFNDRAVIQRCQVHKKRNVLSHLPESEKAEVSKQMTSAYREFEYSEAFTRLNKIAKQLRFRYPSAADSLQEGLEETLTVHRLHVSGLLRKTLSSTNILESANSVCAGVIRRVSNFRTGEVALRQAAAGFMEAERGFHRVMGYRDIVLLQASLMKNTNTKEEITMFTA